MAVCGGEIRDIALTFLDRTDEPWADLRLHTNKHSTDIDSSTRSCPTSMNPDESCGLGLTSLALSENAMIA